MCLTLAYCTSTLALLVSDSRYTVNSQPKTRHDFPGTRILATRRGFVAGTGFVSTVFGGMRLISDAREEDPGPRLEQWIGRMAPVAKSLSPDADPLHAAFVEIRRSADGRRLGLRCIRPGVENRLVSPEDGASATLVCRAKADTSALEDEMRERCKRPGNQFDLVRSVARIYAGAAPVDESVNTHLSFGILGVSAPGRVVGQMVHGEASALAGSDNAQLERMAVAQVNERPFPNVAELWWYSRFPKEALPYLIYEKDGLST